MCLECACFIKSRNTRTYKFNFDKHVERECLRDLHNRTKCESNWQDGDLRGLKRADYKHRRKVWHRGGTGSNPTGKYKGGCIHERKADNRRKKRREMRSFMRNME